MQFYHICHQTSFLIIDWLLDSFIQKENSFLRVSLERFFVLGKRFTKVAKIFTNAARDNEKNNNKLAKK